jgi:hypothetical protein
MDIVVGVVVPLAMLAISSIIAFIVARKYGDVAGTRAAIAHEEERTAQARITALRALLHEVMRIRELANLNGQLQPYSGYQSPVRMPVTALEIAFLSGESVLFDQGEADAELLTAVTCYLTGAYSINAKIDYYLALPAHLGSDPVAGRAMADLATGIRDESIELVGNLGQLEQHFQQRLDTRTLTSKS